MRDLMAQHGRQFGDIAMDYQPCPDDKPPPAAKKALPSSSRYV